MAKVDFKKELKHLYSASAKEVAVVDVPTMNFIMIDGAGDPNTVPEFQEAMGALYPVSYTLKFMLKKSVGFDYVVSPPEGLWWTDDMGRFSVAKKEAWKWTLMIMQPEQVTAELYDEAVAQVRKKKNPPALSKLRLEPFCEGPSVQILHIGPYAAEGPTITKLHHFARENGYRLHGKHHEIYLSDPRRAAPEKMKTILRQPVRLLSEG